MKRIFSLFFAGLFVASSLAGCAYNTAGQGEKENIKAMGRYLETDISLPENTQTAYDLVKMEDGSIRLAVSENNLDCAVWTLDEENESWDKLYDFTVKEKKKKKTFIESIALSPMGGGMAIVYSYEPGEEENSEIAPIYYHFDETGKKKVIPNTSAEYPTYLQSSRDGDFYAVKGGNTINRIDAGTGEEDMIVGKDVNPRFFGLAGGTLYAVSNTGVVTSYDAKSAELLKQDEGLSEAVKRGGMDMIVKTNLNMPLVFTEGSDGKTIFFGGNGGVFRHAQNGSVTEKLIEGTLTSLASPDMGFVAMEVSNDQDIYILGQETGRPVLFKYTYFDDVATIPEKELKAYTLYENPELQQAISKYQKENPAVYITLETGITEESSATVSDALRTLSAEIMAGKGPDLLMMDGLLLDSYIEKGILSDISDLVYEADQEEGLFTNITSAFENEDGSMYAVPLRFHMPVLEGNTESLKKVKDLETLADEAQRLHEKDPDKYVLNPYINGMFMAMQLYDACSAAWLNEDGSVNEEQLEEFYVQLNRIYSLDERSQENYIYGFGYAQSLSGMVQGGLEMYNGRSSLNFGNISTPTDLRVLASTMSYRDTIGYEIFHGQMENTFLPGSIAGINSKSHAPDEIRHFLRFLLGKTAQSMNQGNGMPVNRQGMEELLLGGSGASSVSVLSVGYSDNPENQLEMNLEDLTDGDYRRYLEKAERLNTPSLSNEFIREAVLEQAGNCATGAITAKEAAGNVVDKVKLFLSEG